MAGRIGVARINSTLSLVGVLAVGGAGAARLLIRTVAIPARPDSAARKAEQGKNLAPHRYTGR
jgi:hypothetical protein